MKTLLALAVALILSGCIHTTSSLRFEDQGLYPGLPGEAKYTEIGEVKAYDRSFAWASCDELTANVAKELLRKAKALGGDAVIHVEWPGDRIEPACTRRYGWFAFLVVFGLGPWVTHTEAEGIAVRIEH